LGPCRADETRLLSFNRIQSRVVTGLLTGCNTLKNHLYIVGLIANSLRRRWGAEEEISAHVLCESEALAIFRHTTQIPFFLYSEDVRSLRLRAFLDFIKGTGLP
jgi:hypothetical protein